jgi:hypothetical protein
MELRKAKNPQDIMAKCLSIDSFYAEIADVLNSQFRLKYR